MQQFAYADSPSPAMVVFVNLRNSVQSVYRDPSGSVVRKKLKFNDQSPRFDGCSPSLGSVKLCVFSVIRGYYFAKRLLCGPL